MWQRFKDWANQPYSSDMSLLHWFLFLGLLMILSAAWMQIFKHLKINAGE